VVSIKDIPKGPSVGESKDILSSDQNSNGKCGDISKSNETCAKNHTDEKIFHQ
jgi:hypothetical protein